MRWPFTAFTATLCCCLSLSVVALPGFGQDAETKQADPAQTESNQAEAPAKEEAGDAEKTDDKPADKTGDKAEDKTAEATVEKTDDKTEQSFADLYQEWQDMDARLRELATKFGFEIDEAKRDEFKKQYSELVGQANILGGKLRTAALKTYQAAPNEDEQITRMLVGAIINDIVFARYDDALDIAAALIAGGADAKHFYALRDASRLSLLDLKKVDEIILRFEEAKADDLPRVRLETSQGMMEVELFENEAPGTVGNFINLVEKGFYNGLKFHRVVDGFVAQGGDPKGDGSGGPGYKIKDETDRLDARQHYRGYLSMANSGPNSGGSQFFIIYSTDGTQHLNGRHTVFGRVISGMEVADKFTRVEATNPKTKDNEPEVLIKAEVLRKRDHEYVPDKVAGSETEE